MVLGEEFSSAKAISSRLVAGCSGSIAASAGGGGESFVPEGALGWHMTASTEVSWVPVTGPHAVYALSCSTPSHRSSVKSALPVFPFYRW